ncbi:TetR/AcrR family transcriptional regulator [Acinetobacter nosocomialis]|uniref:TetR/AcrR family transcriptional regulator n=1 Tax=Acinetobacter nosocomialis TaxID=106654 RepID=UPI0002FB7E4D|nr:TetR/AcrR family transcriptional regulator [Acinetobacter nosocomialis]AWL18343.1 TetR/AcrR family transcriptional regulator [Acinetobacter nosocomialis]
MPNLILPTRAFEVVKKGIDLFHYGGFHMVGVDKIVRETEVNKMTFYNYFHSKERFIDICLIVQKERLQDQVVAMMEYDHDTSTIDKLTTLYDLHTNLEGQYYLLFKAIFETKNNYPNAYQTAIRYRTWLTNEIYSQLRLLKADVSFTDARLFLYMIDGAILQLLMSEQTDENDRLLMRFLKQFKFSEPM